MAFKFEVIEPKLFAGIAAEEIAACIQDCLAEKDRCVISLAGGSTPVTTYRALTVPPRVDEIEWSKLDFVFGDERWVPHSDVLSNYRMASENLCSRLVARNPRVHPVDTSMDSPQAAAEDYAKKLAKICNCPEGGTPRIDLLLLGMGDDGHMASLFPEARALSEDFSSQNLVAVENWPGQESSYRITLTPRVLLAANKIIFIIKGHSKSEIVRKALDDKAPPSLPVHIFRAVEKKVTWLTDSEAGVLLNKPDQY